MDGAVKMFKGSRLMESNPRWVKGGLAGMIGLLALMIAAMGHDYLYGLGLVVFLGSIGYIGYLIKITFDEGDAAAAGVKVTEKSE